jgi:hypothetical protein
MEQYHKIQTVYKRDSENNYKTLLDGQFSIPEFEYLKNNKWIFTEKVDGTNVRVQFKDKSVCFRGKSDRAELPKKLLSELHNIFSYSSVRQLLSDADNSEVCLYGEGYGVGIQKGGGNYNKDINKFVLFDVRINDWWLKRADVEDMARILELDIVPVIGEGTLFDMVEMAKNGFDSTWGNFPSEGIVARPAVELFARNGGRIITKIKCKDFSYKEMWT